MYWYITLRADVEYSRFTPTVPLIEFLSALTELQQTGPLAFGAAEGQPWVAIILASCCPSGNYAQIHDWLSEVNIIDLACSYDGDAEWYDDLASRIAQYIGWSAFEDHAERQIWPRLRK